MMGEFCMFYSGLIEVLKINFFSKNSLRNTIRVSNSLDPDQAQHFVAPDLGPNYLQRLSADKKFIPPAGKMLTLTASHITFSR